jgi:glycosyltransferase involved in cell wall biosynthesis
MDLREFETVVSIHYAFAHGVRLEPAQQHFSYVCTPLRYAWRRKGSSMPGSALAHWAGGLVFRRTRRWDRRAAQRVTSYAAVSRWAAANVESAFGRNARVIYPPVQVERFDLAQKREGYFLVVSRLVRHKRVDVVVRAFSQLRELPLLVVGEGPERPVLERIAAPNVHFLGHQADPEVAVLMSRARAFVHAGEEDFGIALVEAQASGCPVITYAGGAARESVSPALHNLLFNEQSPESLLEALQYFAQRRDSVSPADLKAHATLFRTERFQEEFCEWMQKS